MSEKKKITKRRQRSRPGELPQILKTAHGSAYMNYKGRRYFLGTYGSEEAEKERRRIVAEVSAGKGVSPKRAESITVSMLVVRFLDWAQKKYRKNGRSTGSYERFKIIVVPLLSLYAALPVSEFRPLALRAVRQAMIDSDRLCRKTINARIGMICRIFRWGLGHELVPPENVTALEAVDPLQPGEEPVRETEDVEPVELSVVLKTLPLLSPAVAAMVKLQAMTGMRPGEVVMMRPADLYREGDKYPKKYPFQALKLGGCWIYIPEEHKTEHKNKIRFVIITESCQRILEPYLKRQGHDEYVFSPAAEHEIRLAKLRENRKTKVQPSQICRKKAEPKRKPGKKYTPNSYRTSIQRAIERFNERLFRGKSEAEQAELEKDLIPKWFPNQLRHYFATKIRDVEDLEAAQVALGHSSAKTTEIYAQKSARKAINVALQTETPFDDQ